MEISGERISLHLCIIITKKKSKQHVIVFCFCDFEYGAEQRYKALTYKVIHKIINSIDWNKLIKEFLAVQNN